MIDYELAKALKDAGFPQNPDNRELHTPDCKGWDGPSDCTDITRAVVPTLEELIEACKIRISLVGPLEDGTWQVAGQQSYVEFGLIPAIAVAKLYIALNTKTV